jgi:hypothetical protein
MPPVPPPASADVALHLTTLSAGSVLWRLHPASYPATSFKTKPTDNPMLGGRFDGTPADPYPFLYAAPEPQTAVLETLVRNVPFGDDGHRWIKRVAIDGRRVSAVQVTRDLTMVSLLTHADLAAACQDEWLVQADPPDYPSTRYWGSWLRTKAPSADGFVWPSRRNLGHRALILFSRWGEESLTMAGEPAVDLDGDAGAAWLNDLLGPFRIQVAPPRRDGAYA